jgi:hypothetical protein
MKLGQQVDDHFSVRELANKLEDCFGVRPEPC